MGIYDREYYREEPRGFFLGGDRTMVVNLIIINAAVFLADVLLFERVGPAGLPEYQLSQWMALPASLFEKPWEAYTLITSGFAHSPLSVWHVAFNMFFLWLFGRDIEQIYGRRTFLSLYLTLVVFSGLAWVVVQNYLLNDSEASAYGASGAVSGIMIIYVMHFPTRIFHIWGVVPVPVWLLAALYLLQDFLELKTSIRIGHSFARVGFAAHLAGAAFGLIFYKTHWTLASLIPQKVWKKGFRARPRLRVHSPDRDDDDLDARVDEILDKINREGESSLTREERRTLEEASRRYQKRRG
jgi:membrane associated rhomboid family serine protease